MREKNFRKRSRSESSVEDDEEKAAAAADPTRETENEENRSDIHSKILKTQSQQKQRMLKLREAGKPKPTEEPVTPTRV
jgi:hypothetical protein